MGHGSRIEDFKIGDRITADLGDGELYGGVVEKIDVEPTGHHPRGRAEIRWDDGDDNRSIGLEKIQLEAKTAPQRDELLTAVSSPAVLRPGESKQEDEVTQRSKGLRTTMFQDASSARPVISSTAASAPELKRTLHDMDVDEDDGRPRRAGRDPWNAAGGGDPWAEQAARRLRSTRRLPSRSPMRSTIDTPPPTRQPRSVPVNSYAGQVGGFSPSSIDPKVFRMPYTRVSEKDVVVKKFRGEEEDHEVKDQEE